MLSSYEFAHLAVKALDDKKAKDIQILKTDKVTVLADYFILCTANSTTHSKTLADETDKILSQAGEVPLRREGYRSGGWTLLDFGCVFLGVGLGVLGAGSGDFGADYILQLALKGGENHRLGDGKGTLLEQEFAYFVALAAVLGGLGVLLHVLADGLADLVDALHAHVLGELLVGQGLGAADELDCALV